MSRICQISMGDFLRAKSFLRAHGSYTLCSIAYLLGFQLSDKTANNDKPAATTELLDSHIPAGKSSTARQKKVFL